MRCAQPDCPAASTSYDVGSCIRGSRAKFYGSVQSPVRLTHQQRVGRRLVRQGRPRFAQVQAALFDPPPFDPAKLTVRYLAGASSSDRDSVLTRCRRYTLTHNDVTGSLHLSVGCEFNQQQLSGWYTKIVRDEVLAEWQPNSLALNVYCHVSGEELWPAPPALRSFIFQREMRLVLDTIAYAERHLLETTPSFAAAPVYVHLVSDVESLNQVIAWGVLGDRNSWQGARLQEVNGALRRVLDLVATIKRAFSRSESWEATSVNGLSTSLNSSKHQRLRSSYGGRSGSQLLTVTAQRLTPLRKVHGEEGESPSTAPLPSALRPVEVISDPVSSGKK